MACNRYLTLLLLSIIGLVNSYAVVAEENNEQNTSKGLETFFAIGLAAGVRETNFVNSDFERVNKTGNFAGYAIEIQLRWNGLFLETPGLSQENVDALFSGPAIGYNFYNSKHWAFDIYAVTAFEPAEYQFRSVILERERNYRLGLRATGYYSDYLAQFIATPVSFEDDIGGFNASFSLRRTWLVKNWNIYASLGVSYQSDEIVNHYWGVSETEAAQIADALNSENTPFTQYQADGGMFTVGEIGFEYPVSESFVVGGFISAVRRPNAVVNSPLTVAGRNVSNAGFSLTYVF
jgi:hypothetical protein